MIKRIGKTFRNLLLTIEFMTLTGLSALISGCGNSDNQGYRPAQNTPRDSSSEQKSEPWKSYFVDLNGDKIQDLVYIALETGENKFGEDHYWRDNSIWMRKGKGSGEFDEPKLLHRIDLLAEDFACADMNHDGIADIVYLISEIKPSYDRRLDARKERCRDFFIGFRPGKGDGTFGEPMQLQTLDKRPDNFP